MRRNMLQHLIQVKALFKVQTANIRGTDTHRILRPAATSERGIGSQHITLNHKKTVIVIPLTRHQFIYKGKVHIVIQSVQGSDQGIYWIIFVE